VVAVDEVVAAVAAEYLVVRNNLLGLPTRLAPRLVLIRDAEQLRAILQAEISKLLEDLRLDGGSSADPAAR
jgi:hypothetical protein